jgi:thiamine pyrophosphate-dependent acetolactate synthase large subunit-like protein
VKLSESLGVRAEKASTCAEFNDALGRAVATRGPRLIACMIA